MNNEEKTTQPTIETLLARINEWGERNTSQLAEIKEGQDELRAELNGALRRVERKIEILNDNILTVNADIRDFEVRLEKLEAERLAKN